MSAGPIESQVSIGFGESGGTERPGAKAILPERSDHSLDNVCCLLLYCKTHRRLAVKRMSKGLFLPYRAYRPNESWRRVTAALRNRILEQFGNDANCGRGRCSEPEMLDIFRVQWPKSRQWYTRLTVLIKMEAEIMSPSTQHPKMAPKSPNKRSPKTETEKKKGSRCYCRVSTSSIIWMGAEELAKHINKFWGPEVAIFYQQLQESDLDKFQLTKNYADCSVHYALRVLINREQDGPGRKSKELLRSAKYNKLAAVRLLNEFIGHCYPSRYLNFNSFKVLMCRLFDSKQAEEWPLTFRAFNYRGTNYLSFEEFMLGLAAMDTTSPHSGTCLEVRLSYIFRYFDADGDSRLNLAKLSQMNNDLLCRHKDDNLAETTSAYFTNLISRSNQASLEVEQFLFAVASNKSLCQQTSLLFRAPSSILLVIATKFDYGSTSIYANQSALASIALQAHQSKPCQVCRCSRFHLSADGLGLSTNGDVSRLIGLEHQTPDGAIIEAARDKIPFVKEIKRSELTELALLLLSKVTSLGRQSEMNVTNEEAVRLWDFDSLTQLSSAVKRILLASKTLLAAESKIVPINAPCYVISGLYGNLADLLIYGRLWKTAPQMSPATFLFLGNLVGPQPWSLEVVLYVFCLKILTPHRFIVLRGIQEVRDNQKQANSFYRDCLERFGNEEIWNLANEVFDLLPLGATIEERIFCSSSSFPRTRRSLQSINATLEKTLSDPLREECVRDILSTEVFDNALATGEALGEEMFRQFCQRNRLCCMIRSHPTTLDSDGQSLNSGKAFYFGYKVISLCSGSALRNTTTSFLAFVTRGHIRLLRVDTSLPTRD